MKKLTIQRYLALTAMASIINQHESKELGLGIREYSSPITKEPKYKLKPGQKIWSNSINMGLAQIEYNGPSIINDINLIKALDLGVFVIAATKKAARKKLKL